MLLTYPSFLVDISSVLYEQPYNISVTITYSCSEWIVFKILEKKKKTTKKKKTKKSTVIYKVHFLSFNDQPNDLRLNLLLGCLYRASVF